MSAGNFVDLLFWRYIPLVYYTKVHLATSEMKKVGIAEIDLIFKITREVFCTISII